ncbi:DUF192 domain-containing protein [Bacteriovorax sp. Seq25_V]|uniref:DUF192 domain-containing protein n=1 Tax=Bacteriovorax sp. Seq25_V TaxID=1201288 RepID=UPI0012F766A4|nr:DUF192 domain-containing protein [Bacteriovorax sp. Seq25_V]
MCIFFNTLDVNAQFLNSSRGSSELIAPNGHIISVSFAISNEEKTKGLSGLHPSKMKFNEGLFFVYNNMSSKTFWMPNTYFNLDIIFLDLNMKVVGLEKNVQHFKGREPIKSIPVTPTYYSAHVLELHAGEADKYKIELGSVLKWKKYPYFLSRPHSP